ncbi:MAG: hypothetical protein K2Z81_04095 [Cyanobacteria bacterium]|nr:hypothetical protein [Cyanobacteriota bacterium]
MCSGQTKQNSSKQASRTRAARNYSGNMLAIASLSFAIAALAVLIGYSFAGLFFVNNRLQSSTDEIAIAGAKKLNEKDRIGQLNNMVVRCRQLVYSSREELDRTRDELPFMAPFAEPLLDEARDSANDLEQERQRVAKLAKDEGEVEVLKRFMDVKSTYAMALPWLTISEPNLEDVVFGQVNEVESNVEELTQIPELAKNDESQGYVTTLPAPALKLYKASLPNGIPLQGPDGDLKFKLSSLPAPVDNIIAPARVILPGKLKSIPTTDAPSVVRVSLQLEVQNTLGLAARANITSTAAATTTGAAHQQ